MVNCHGTLKLVRKETQKIFYWSHLGSEGWFELRSEDVVGSEAGPKTQASPAPGGGTSRRENTLPQHCGVEPPGGRNLELET